MKRTVAILLLVMLALSAAAGCAGNGASARQGGARNSAGTANEPLALSLTQTTFNAWTKRSTERAHAFSVHAGDKLTVQSDTKAFLLTFTIDGVDGEGVHMTVDHGMLSYADGVRAEKTSRTFTVPLGVVFVLDEPADDITASYAFLFKDTQAEQTPAPDGTLLTQPQVLSNVRRTLHENGKFYFSDMELSMILFAELKGGEVLELDELKHLTSLETLTLHKTRVRDLSPLTALTALRELTLTDNALLDCATMPVVPSLVTLTLDDGFTDEEIRMLQTKLPKCKIIIDTGIEGA